MKIQWKTYTHFMGNVTARGAYKYHRLLNDYGEAL